ncbi:MAG: MBL fold metallo-hydrolase [Enterocloster clostridioformis]
MGNTSAWFEADGCLFLVDCGETVYELLMKRSSLREYRQIYVLLTHLHADHVGSLGSLISYNYCILGKKNQRHSPQGNRGGASAAYGH